MNTLEDRVRSAAQAAANAVTPDSVPSLRLPAGHVGQVRRHSRRGMRGRTTLHGWPRLAPVLAAAAVVAVAIATTVIVQAARSAGNPAGAGLSGAAAVRAVPKYYVHLESSGTVADGNPLMNPLNAVVRATATGAPLATVKPPAGSTFVGVTAAADDQTFVLTAQPWITHRTQQVVEGSGPGSQQFQPTSFYLLRLSPSSPNDPATLARLSTIPAEPPGWVVKGLALSAAGTELAVAVQPPHQGAMVAVYTLATGAVRSWHSDGTVTGSACPICGSIGALSWTADGGTLAVDWLGTKSAPEQGVRLLDVTGPGGSLVADSRQAVSFGTSKSPVLNSPICGGDAVITPDGSLIVCEAEILSDPTYPLRPLSSSGARGSRVFPLSTLYLRQYSGVAEFSTATGKLVRILVPDVTGVEVLWTNASGSVVVGRSPFSARVGIVSGDLFTSIPWPTSKLWMFNSAAW